MHSRKLYACLVLTMLQLTILPAKAAIETNVISPVEVPVKIEEASQTVLQLNSLNHKQIISSGAFEAKKNKKLIIEVTSTIEDSKVELFLFSPAGKQIQYTFFGKNQTIEVDLTEGQWAYNCTGFWKGRGNIAFIGKLIDCQ